MDKKCYTCKFFEEPFGYLDENCRCGLKGQYTKGDKCCEEYIQTSQQFIDYDENED